MNFWEENKIEDQIQKSKTLIKVHQENRKFTIELIIAVIGIGIFINLLTSLVYDVYIKHELVLGSSIWITLLAFITLFLFYLIYWIFLKYSPKQPILIKIIFNPTKNNGYLQKIWPKLREILDDSENQVFNKICDLFKGRIEYRPPLKLYWKLKKEVLDYRWVNYYYEGDIREVKTKLDITFGYSSILSKYDPWLSINVEILKPYLSGAEYVFEEETLMIIVEDVLYALETAIRNFLKD